MKANPPGLRSRLSLKERPKPRPGQEGQIKHTSELEAKAQAEPRFISQTGKKMQMKGDQVCAILLVAWCSPSDRWVGTWPQEQRTQAGKPRLLSRSASKGQQK